MITETNHLVGTRIRLWPYVRGVYGRDTLYRLWCVIEEAQAGPLLFWASQDQPEIHSDLVAFVKFFDDPTRLLQVVTNIDSTEIIGCIWFDEIVPRYRAFGSMFIVPKFQGGTYSREAMDMGLRYAFEILELKQVWGATPWLPARRLCLRSGFEVVAMLPGFTLVNGVPVDVTILRIMKEQFHG